MPKRRRGARSALPRSSLSHAPFERLVERALAGIPSPFREALAEVAIVIDDEPTAQQRRDNELPDGDTLYGLYEGVPRTEYGRRLGRASRTGSPSSGCRSRRTSPIRPTSPDEVRITVIHELAHHLGIDDDRLDELGI